jgi:uncharacterized membrane protein YfcA
MDGPILALFVLSAFVGGIVSGLAGFAMGLVVSGVWLHILTPAQTAALIVGYGLLVQTYSIWKLRHALSLRTLAPFIGGGVIGVPLGAALLSHISPAAIRDGVGVLLIVYSGYFLIRPHVHTVQASLPADVGIGFLNGILGGMTGLAGPIITIWCQLRGFRRDEQRAVFQPVILAAFALTAVSLAINGTVTKDLIRTFRRVVLVLLMLSGLVLLFG